MIDWDSICKQLTDKWQQEEKFNCPLHHSYHDNSFDFQFISKYCTCPQNCIVSIHDYDGNVHIARFIRKRSVIRDILAFATDEERIELMGEVLGKGD